MTSCYTIVDRRRVNHAGEAREVHSGLISMQRRSFSDFEMMWELNGDVTVAVYLLLKQEEP